MLIDKIREFQKENTALIAMMGAEMNFPIAEMAQALIAVDDVLKEAARDLSEDLKEGVRDDGKRLLMLEIRKAMESTKED